jgi:hypothetical protein
MAYPFPALDTSRTTERLSVFLTEYIESKPVDQYFEAYPIWDRFYKNKVKYDGGAQWSFPIGTGESPNNKYITGLEVIGTAIGDTARHVVYTPFNVVDSIAISYVEMREIAGSDHKIFDRMKFQRDRVVGTTAKKLSEDLWNAAQVANEITALPVAIDSTGTCGNLSAATESTWASQEVAGSGAYAAVGYESVLELHQQMRQVKSIPTVIFVPFDIERDMEVQFDADVRYGNPSDLKRGATSMMIKGLSVIADADMAADTIFMLDESSCKLYVDSACDMRQEPLKPMDYQFGSLGKFIMRGQVIITDRRAQGKITSVT